MYVYIVDVVYWIVLLWSMLSCGVLLTDKLFFFTIGAGLTGMEKGNHRWLPRWWLPVIPHTKPIHNHCPACIPAIPHTLFSHNKHSLTYSYSSLQVLAASSRPICSLSDSAISSVPHGTKKAEAAAGGQLWHGIGGVEGEQGDDPKLASPAARRRHPLHKDNQWHVATRTRMMRCTIYTLYYMDA